MSAPRLLRVRSVIVKDPKGPRGLSTFMQGDEIPARFHGQLNDGDLVPVGETVEESTSVTVPVAPDPLAVSTEDLSKYLAESKATGPQVVALATAAGADEPDSARAEALLAAEKHMAGGDGRVTVMVPLQKIIDAAAAGSGGGAGDGSDGGSGSADEGGGASA